MAAGKGNSIAIGSDGLPVISYVIDDYSYPSYLKVAKCHNLDCSSSTINMIDSGRKGSGQYMRPNTIFIGSDGLPVITYPKSDVDVKGPKVAKCHNLDCSSFEITQADLETLYYQDSAI